MKKTALPAVTPIPHAPLSDYTTFQLGGACPLLLKCPKPEDVREAVNELRAQGIPFVLMGEGSNLLVADEGMDVAVLRYCTDTPDIQVEESSGIVTVSGATRLDELVAEMVRRGWTGVTTCSGIPGTVGGAIAGNAGAFGQQIGDVVDRVECLNLATGATHTLPATALAFGYRQSALSTGGHVLLSARLRLVQADPTALAEERAGYLEQRKRKHPDWRTEPCAGSFFRNIAPTSSSERRQAAGWFLEAAGAHLLRVGGARVFSRHANIIVKDPGGTALDVWKLSQQMAHAVREKFGIELKREVRIWGSFPP